MDENNNTQQPEATPQNQPVKEKQMGSDEGADVFAHSGWGEFTPDNIADAVGVRELNGIMGTTAALMARQHLLNPKKYRAEYKKPNPGKMPNNKDAFPVDLKIEEFETHFPATKIYEITTHVHGKEAAEAAMSVGNNAEKRLVKLENNMATLMRLLFRIGARMHVNCLYYGGQTPFEKYKTIRCLCDDRISDGQNVQLDQCLYCTRYEPVYGQCYEIMNDLGANVATILDENQMSYTNMDDRIALNRVESFHEEAEHGVFDINTVLTRSPEEVDFSTAWGEGIKMDWKYVPKEEQKTHINWRQSINDDGSSLKPLDSFPCSEQNAGANIVANGSAGANIMKRNKDAMEIYQPRQEQQNSLKDLITQAKSVEGQRDDCANFYRGGGMNDVKQECSNSGFDPLFVAVLAFLGGGRDVSVVISKLKTISEQTQSNNPAILTAAYGTCVEGIIGDKIKRIPRIDQKFSRTPNKNGDSNSSNEDDPDNDGVNLVWDDREDWLWTDFAPRLMNRLTKLGIADMTGGMALFPKVVYLYMAVLPLCMNSRFDTEQFGFPFFDSQFDGSIAFTSPYGPRDLGGHSFHYGIDLGAEEGTVIHAVADGVVACAGSDGEAWDPANGALCVRHSDGETYSRYLHCSEFLVSAGQKVVRGQEIAKVGNVATFSTGPHLHFELSPGDACGSGHSPCDPASYYPIFQSTVSKGDALSPA